jgi:hypothetical protein
MVLHSIMVYATGSVKAFPKAGSPPSKYDAQGLALGASTKPSAVGQFPAIRVYPLKFEQSSVRKRWFWKWMLLGGIALHPLILGAMWFVDVATKSGWHAAATMLTICAGGTAFEGIVLSGIINHFRPETPE